MKLKIGQRLYFKDRSYSDVPCIVAAIEGEWVRFKAEHGKLSAKFHIEWLRPDPVPEGE